MRKIFISLCCALMSCAVSFSQQTLQEKLGYAKDAKLLIIHADDLGVTHSENEGSIQAMEKGVVNSASIMIPTPWVQEIASYAVSHPKADLGLHLVLTSEWKNYKWDGITGKSQSPGLHNKKGFLYPDQDSVYKMASLKEVENELRAQIEKAKVLGIDFTHFDSHMAVLFNKKEYMKILIRLGREYKVPILITRDEARSANRIGLNGFLTPKDILLDTAYTAQPSDFEAGMEQFYVKCIGMVRPGVSEFIIHTAFDDTEMQSVTIDHPTWGAKWRQDDFNFFTSEKCKQLLKDNNIQLITYREIRDKLLRN